MDLPRAGREYAHIPVGGVPTGATPEAQIGDGSWTALESTEAVDSEGRPIWRFLVYGPDAPVGAGIPVAGPSDVRVRVVDAPETVIRKALSGIRLV